MRYHVPVLDPDESFEMTVTPRRRLATQDVWRWPSSHAVQPVNVTYMNGAFDLEICVRYRLCDVNSFGDVMFLFLRVVISRWRPVYEDSGMAIVELQLLSGYATERFIMKKVD